LWAGQSVSYLGSQVSLLALPLTAAVVLGAGPVQMGVLTALGRAPYLLFGLPVGVWVDRLPRRRSLVAVNLALAVVLAVVPAGALLGWLSLGLLYVVAFLSGALTVFFDIAYLAYVPVLVPAGQRPGAQGMIEVTQSTGQLAGPAVGGWLVQVLTAPVAVAVDAVSYLVAAVSVGMIADGEPVRAGVGGSGVVSAIRAGLRVVFGQPVLRAVTLATTTLVFWTSATSSVLVLYLLRCLGFAPWVLGVVLSAGAVGGLLGALTAPGLGRRVGMGPVMAAALVVTGVGAALTPVAGLVPAGAAIVVVVVSQVVTWWGQQVYHVQQVPVRYALTVDEMHGRVNATIRTVVWGTAPLGALLGGFLGHLWGLPAVLVVAAAGTAASAVWILASPARWLHHTSDLTPATPLPA
jgi:MFS family permease